MVIPARALSPLIQTPAAAFGRGLEFGGQVVNEQPVNRGTVAEKHHAAFVAWGGCQ
jgi:hypothetical protein